MRRWYLFLVLPLIFVAGWSLPTTAEGATALTPIADYLHQVAAGVPAPRASMFDRVEVATTDPSCASMVPALRAAHPAAVRILRDDDAPEGTRKAAAQVLAYTGEVGRLCGATPR